MLIIVYLTFINKSETMLMLCKGRYCPCQHEKGDNVHVDDMPSVMVIRFWCKLPVGLVKD